MQDDPRWQAFQLSQTAQDKLKVYNDLLKEWSARMNLVARSTLESAAERHFLDSAQVFPHLPTDAKRLVDFGSGAGFPGLVLAIMAEDANRDLHLTLIESTGKKCNFLNTVKDKLNLSNLSVQHARIEVGQNPQKADVITARALASLDRLLSYADPYLKSTTTCLFLKGQNVEAELTEATTKWKMDIELHPSLTAPDARLTALTNISAL